MSIAKDKIRQRRHRRVRAKVKGTADCPRLAAYRSLKHIRVQLIDDSKGVTLVSVHDTEIKGAAKLKPIEIAAKVGVLVAERALGSGLKRIVFDRGGYAYHGRIRALAEGARQGGLEF